jgi:flagellin-like hook-associated protein FlgL
VTGTNLQGQPTQVSYEGAADSVQSIVGPGQTVTPFVSGREVFQSVQRQATDFTGPTGARSGTGTDSATGQGSLIVRHDITSYAAGSGVQAGTQSATGDNIIGPAGANVLHIEDVSGNGTSGTVSLNGGPPVPFSNADTNLMVAGPSGQVVYIDTTNIVPGFSGDVAITTTGSMSVDDGATFTPITFSANQQLTDSRSGAVTNVNSTAIRSSGTDSIVHIGTYDAFQTLIALRDTLRDPALSDNDRSTAISKLVNEIDRVSGAVENATGEQAAMVQDVGQLQTRLQELQLQAKQLTSNLGDADLAQVVVQMQAQQNMLQASFYGFSTMLRQSLLDFLR